MNGVLLHYNCRCPSQKDPYQAKNHGVCADEAVVEDLKRGCPDLPAHTSYACVLDVLVASFMTMKNECLGAQEHP